MFQTLQTVTIILASIGMALSLAHALEYPGKRRLDRDTYLKVQAIYYPGFTVGGIFEPDDERTHIFISSGTGNAPFVAMMRHLLKEGGPRPVVFLNGVSYERDLGYRSLVEGWERSREYPVTYVPTVSRPKDPANASWTGRTGRVESILPSVLDELRLTPDNSIAYICGNPDMIISAEETLLARGYPEAQVKKELYWPKGKEPRGAEAA